MREKTALSDRLSAIVSMVTPGNRVCDIGCDHGFVPIYLVKQGISPSALAMDVREGPLSQAKIHIRDYNLENLIQTRLSDGLSAFRAGEAETLICAGMGGRLLMRILSEEADKAASFRELILQPQSEVGQFRAFLRRQGYLCVDENMIEEDGKFYPMMKAVYAGEKAERTTEGSASAGQEEDAAVRQGESVPVSRNEMGSDSRNEKKSSGQNGAELNYRNKTVTQGYSFGGCNDCDGFWQQMEDRYGPLLLARKHPVLYRYLKRELRLCDEILEQLFSHGTEEAGKNARIEEVKKQRQDCLTVIKERYGDGYGENYD